MPSCHSVPMLTDCLDRRHARDASPFGQLHQATFRRIDVILACCSLRGGNSGLVRLQALLRDSHLELGSRTMVRLSRLLGLRTSSQGRWQKRPRRSFRKLATERLEERFVLAAQTTGLFVNSPQSFQGYTLFSPQQSHTTYLINNEGTVINTWQSDYLPGLLSILRPDGTLLRAGVEGGNPTISAPGAGGHLEILSWDGDLLWSYSYNTPQHLQHHDIKALPNGNILILAWEFKTETQATAAGRDPDRPRPGSLYPDSVVELRPNLAAGTGADIVWEWHVWDHLVQNQFPNQDNYFGPAGVSQHPELVNINYVNTTI